MKYIVNDLANQSITGNLNLDGDLRIVDGNDGTCTYKALLTQTASITGTGIGDFYGALIIGESYTINNYVASDDFSNIANVTSGTINTNGCVFTATGSIPQSWNSGSELISAGNLVVNVIENNLGFSLDWYDDFIPGVYFAVRSDTGPLFNTFPRERVSITATNSQVPFAPPVQLSQYSVTSGIGSKDSAIITVVFDYDSFSNVADYLYYSPIEVTFRQDLDTTPIVAAGTVTSGYPFSNAAVDLFSGGNFVETIYADNYAQSSADLSELVSLLNSDIRTRYLGTFADDGSGGIELTIPTNIKNQFSPNGTLTFEVFAD